MNSHEEIWKLLERDPPKGASLTARVAFPNISEQLLAAIDVEGNRHFLIRLLPGEESLTDNGSRGIAVTCKDLHVKGETPNIPASRYMVIRYIETGAHEGFDMIGGQIAESLAHDDISKSESVRRILARWRYFWGRPAGNVLSQDEIIGLFSELWFLLHWLLPFMGAAPACISWRGPHAGRHDFEWPGYSVEVKGTTLVGGRKHRIHGIEQLSAPEHGRLFLFSMRLRVENGATNTLPGLIGMCRDKLADDIEALEMFEDSLAMTGYSPAHDEEYEKLRLRVIDGVMYRVESLFPRITPETLKDGVPSGVSFIDYDISLDGFDELIVSRTPGSDIFDALQI